MKKILSCLCLLALSSFFVLLPPKTGAANKMSQPHTAAAVSAGNNYYTIYVEDATPDYGTYTVATGANHPATIAMGTPQDILYDGADGNPWSTYLSMRSYNSDTEYTTSASPSASPGYVQVDLDTYAGATTSTATSVTSNWSVNNVRGDNFSIRQTVAVEGTTFEDSRVRVTTTVTNDSLPSSTLYLGLRYEWDIMIDGEDGSYVKSVDPYSSWYSTETEASSPSMQQFQAVNDVASPIFYVNGSVNGPAFSPAPTAPSLVQFVDWGDVAGAAFDYTPTGQTIAGPSYDSAITYFWGDNENNAIILGEGQSTSVTQYLFAPMTESNPSSSPSILPQTGSK